MSDYFARSVLEAARLLEIRPDVVYANDWTTALLPVYLKTFYARQFPGVRTMMMIHNTGYGYQG